MMDKIYKTKENDLDIFFEMDDLITDYDTEENFFSEYTMDSIYKENDKNTHESKIKDISYNSCTFTDTLKNFYKTMKNSIYGVYGSSILKELIKETDEKIKNNN